ncbi:hypothetical protein [Synechococcus sp. PCC 7502]|uniref:hypothetical protein n=1 Tax=Synechococcus sp. PCC 7502 TaxID=1173263 RepID=UPI0002D88394|nr:hypothetical protein [Synechococcus sp. PCC 7502]
MPIYIPVLIDSDRIVFGIEVENQLRTWNRAGTLTRKVLLDGIGFAVEEPKTLAIAKNILEFQPEGNYRLEFTPFKWIQNYTISIWKL